MNPLAPLLRDEDILLDVEVADRDELFKVVAHHLAQRHHLNEREVTQALTARERLGSTAVGSGFAIPHARMEQVHEPAGVFVRIRRPIAFDAPDAKPVSQALVLIVPKQCNELHLQLLATAAGAFADKAFCDDLKGCARCDEVRARLSQWDETAPKAAAR